MSHKIEISFPFYSKLLNIFDFRCQQASTSCQYQNTCVASTQSCGKRCKVCLSAEVFGVCVFGLNHEAPPCLSLGERSLTTNHWGIKTLLEFLQKNSEDTLLKWSV